MIRQKKISIAAGLLFAVVLSGVALACRPEQPATKDTRGPEAPRGSAPLSAWDQLVQAGQKEGTVNIYGGEIAPLTVPLREAFGKKFNINLEFTLARAPQLLAKLTAERRAGLYIPDVIVYGKDTLVNDIKPLGATTPLADLLVLPEVKNPENWTGGKLPFWDDDRHIFIFTTIAAPSIVVNTEQVREVEIASFLDILKPQYKGKIVFADPTISGPSPNTLALLIKVLGRDRAVEVFKQLAAQEPVVTRDQRLLLEWVARGKYPVGLGASQSLYGEFSRAGAPVKFLVTREPRFSSTGPGCIVLFNDRPHPRAAQVFLNWLLAQEGGTIWSKASGYPSRRVDVGKEHIDPAFIPRGDEIFLEDELRIEMRTFSRQVFGALLK